MEPEKGQRPTQKSVRPGTAEKQGSPEQHSLVHALLLGLCCCPCHEGRAPGGRLFPQQSQASICVTHRSLIALPHSGKRGRAGVITLHSPKTEPGQDLHKVTKPLRYEGQSLGVSPVLPKQILPERLSCHSSYQCLVSPVPVTVLIR